MCGAPAGAHSSHTVGTWKRQDCSDPIRPPAVAQHASEHMRALRPRGRYSAALAFPQPCTRRPLEMPIKSIKVV